MTYNIKIDLEFATMNNLTLVQVCTLASFMTLPIWSESKAINGKVWYQYSEDKMAEDFPLLFGVPKRCYKNITELAEMGFVELTKENKIKYVRFTEKCCSWNREKVQKRTNSEEKSENGLNSVQNRTKNSPKTDFTPINYNIKDSNIKTNKSADGTSQPDLFGETPSGIPKGTREGLCLFENSRFHDFTIFEKEFDKPEFAGIDIYYYYQAISDWSASGGKKKHDWIATARNWMRSDMSKNQLHRIKSNEVDPDMIEYLHSMQQ